MNPLVNFRRDSNTEIAVGTIIAEFTCGTDALHFARMKGNDYTVTAGINHVFAVRKGCAHPVKYIRADEHGVAACTLCEKSITEPAVSTPSDAVDDRQADSFPVSPAGVSTRPS